MSERRSIRVVARVQWHANGGYTRVEYLEGRGNMEIPTESIPIDLRKIGSQFYLIIHLIRSEDFDKPEMARAVLADPNTLHRLLTEEISVEPIEDISN